jgi:putative redox protein
VPKPPVLAQLTWKHGLVFDATSGTQAVVLDGDSAEGPSPVQTLVLSIAGCMAADLAHILTKGRIAFRAIRAEVVADRAQENPHRIVSVALRFQIEGSVPPAAVDRAIALSRDTYCSVWHSMRQDIQFTTSFEIVA